MKPLPLILPLLFLILSPPARTAAVDDAIAAIREVGAEGEGNREAAQAWQTLAARDASAILPLLNSMAESPPLARNWIRSALEVIFSRVARENPDQLPLSEIEAFLLDPSGYGPARDLALALLATVRPARAAELEPGFLDDPSPDLRRRSVALLVEQGRSHLDEGRREEAVELLREALAAARHADQIQDIAQFLRKRGEVEVDLPGQFGFLMDWHLIGPFDNTDLAGFDAIYPPETTVDLGAVYPGKDDREVTWRPHTTDDDYGMVDFNEPFGYLKGVVGYAFTEFHSDRERDAELRLGCKNAWKVWFNGELVFGRDEYHRGMRIDQYQLPVRLQEGTNTILLKICQNEETQDWTKEWQFQLRVCDPAGSAILSTDRRPVGETPVTSGRP